MATETSNGRLVVVGLLVIALLVVVPGLLVGLGTMGAGPMAGPIHEHGMATGWASGWLLVAGLVLRALVLAVLLGGGYLLLRSVSGSADETDRAMEELRVSYARGDLTDEEYERRREVLERDE